MAGARRALLAIAVSLAAAACGKRADLRDRENPPAKAALSGFDSVTLAAVERPQDAGAPSGSFRYEVVEGALDWYVAATGLRAARFYRVVMTAADGREYAVASERSAADGSFTAHGIETLLMNRQCVGLEDPSRRTLGSVRTVLVSVKNDGSRAGPSGSDFLGSRSALPCHGNGDGDFGYVLHALAPLALTP